MMVKAVTLFLIAMLILGILGKLRVPKLPSLKKGGKIPAAKKCRKCGTYILGDGPCSCEDRS